MLSGVRAIEQSFINTQSVCRACTGCVPGELIECVSLDCPWMYARRKGEYRLESAVALETAAREVGYGHADDLLSIKIEEDWSDYSTVNN